MTADQAGNPGAAESGQHRPDLGAAGALRRLGREVHRVAGVAGRQVGGLRAHSGAQRLAVAHQGDAAVVRRVQPLVSVGRPGVGGGGARDLAGQLGACGGPQPEGTVDMHPRALRMRPVDERAERVAGTAVDVAGLEAHDRRGVQIGQVRGNDPPLTVGGQPQRPAAAEPDQAQGLEHRCVHLIAHHHLDRGRAEQPQSGGIPAGSGQHGVSGCRQAGRVGHRRPGDEAPGRLGRQAEQLADPADGHRVKAGRDRRHDRQRGVLVPRGEEPRGRDRDRPRPAGDEPEVARTRAGHRGRRAQVVEGRQNPGRLESRLRQPELQLPQGKHRLGRRGHGAIAEPLQVAPGPHGRVSEQGGS